MMLGRFFRRRQRRNTGAWPQLGMVATRSNAGLSPESILQAARELFPESEIEASDGDDPDFGFECDGVTVIVVPMPFPIPRPDVDEAVVRSWMWPGARAAMGAQHEHVLVTALGGASGRETSMAATRLAAAVCQAGDAVGVYWGNAGHVLEPGAFVKDATATDAPVHLWVGLVISGKTEDGPYSMSSCGMAELGLPELEVVDTATLPAELADIGYSLVAYLVENGPVLEDGHTFGPTAEIKWRVEHTRSVFRRGERVLRLHLP